MTASPATCQPCPDFGLIVIGDEILSGKRVDQHLGKVIELLRARGLQLSSAEYVGDQPERITALLERAFASGQVIFCTGGIGATPDDHTRQCAALALKRPLLMHPQALALIENRIRKLTQERGEVYDPGAAENVQRQQMAMLPAGAEIIPNPYNQIAGFSLERLHFLPGFPVMAWPMIEWLLDTHYAAWFTNQSQLERSVIVFGAIEAALTPLMQDIERQHANVKVFSLPSVDHPQWGRHIELGVKGARQPTELAYAALLDGLRAQPVKLGPELVRG